MSVSKKNLFNLKDFDDYIKTINNVSTRMAYSQKLKKFFSVYSLDDVLSNPDVLKNQNIFTSLSTKHQFYCALASYLKYINNYPEFIKELVMKASDDAKVQTKQKELPKYKELYNLWQKIPEKTNEDLEAKVIIDIFLNYPPLRSDLFNLKKECVTPDTILFGKCIKTNKPIEDLKLNKTSQELIKKYLPNVNGDFFIEMKHSPEQRILFGNPTHKLTRITKKYLHTQLSINDFRKIAVIRIEDENKLAPPSVKFNKMFSLSKKMGHSFTTQQKNYNKDQEINYKNGNIKDILNISKNYNYFITPDENYLVIKLPEQDPQKFS